MVSCARLKLLMPLLVNRPPPLLLCCVTNGLLLGGLELASVLDGFS